jgi:GTPase involved in cell partitioning and DNA repair
MYDEELARKPEVIVWTKADIISGDELEVFKNELTAGFVAETGCNPPVLVVSAVRGDGLSALLGLLAEMLDIHPERPEPDEKVPEYIDGEPPEGLSLSELSMERLESDAEDKGGEQPD